MAASDSNCVEICECVMRDGLQAFPELISADDKVALISSLSECGFRIMEATSFAHPKVVKQFVDAVEVLERIPRPEDITFIGLVPNMKGMERALALKESGKGVDAIIAIVSASESHNKDNLGSPLEDSMKDMERVVKASVDAGIMVIASIATSFGCPIEGDVPVEKVMELAVRFRDFGASRVMFGDTTGVANPRQVSEFYSKFFDTVKDIRPQSHFHDTRGLALANSYAAYREGVRHFDASLGGLGGRPAGTGLAYAKAHMGNVATEDLVNMFEEMDVDTGIDLDRLIECSAALEKVTGQGTLWSKLPKAGRVKH